MIIIQDTPVNLFDAVKRRERLAAEYLDKIGYDPFMDDPTISVDEVEEILREYDEAEE